MIVTHFATFGGSQLRTFDVKPMSIMLVTDNEAELRQTLNEPPFNNGYCTTYPISYAEDMELNYGMYQITLAELLRLER